MLNTARLSVFEIVDNLDGSTVIRRGMDMFLVLKMSPLSPPICDVFDDVSSRVPSRQCQLSFSSCFCSSVHIGSFLVCTGAKTTFFFTSIIPSIDLLSPL
jgi:hypothetical protein